ncbi:hypothetical protein MMC07_002920 [Pseudocyphellaria aurata]|nr:hypothetical protein [Pseudocyphellaria aurata]
MAPTSLDPLSWLLLLPYSPSIASLTNLRVSYESGLRQALKMASHSSSRSQSTTLDIALVYEEHSLRDGSDVCPDYIHLQRLLGLIYRLICIICTEESIDIEYENDVDARVLFFSGTEDPGRTTQEHDEDRRLQNPLIPFQMLALCPKPWKRVCFLENQNGRDLRENFLQVRYNSPHADTENLDIEGVAGGVSIGTSSQNPLPGASSMQSDWKRHSSIAVGGTFDHLHAGHKLLLTMTALLLNLHENSIHSKSSLTIGITGDELLKKKQYVDQLQGWDERQAVVREFLLGILQMSSPADTLKFAQRLSNSDTGARTVREEFESGFVINYVEIFDAFGPTITDESISALVISGETRSGGLAVNDKREAKGWSSLEVFEVDVLDAALGDDSASDRTDENYQGKISSTEIRRRLHNRAAVGH